MSERAISLAFKFRSLLVTLPVTNRQFKKKKKEKQKKKLSCITISREIFNDWLFVVGNFSGH